MKATHKQSCADCGHYFWYGEMVFHSKYGYRNFICQKCAEREHMTNIKITAEVNGKQVPLETISTETFEAIKVLEKPKEIPVARVGNYTGYPSDKRLFLKLTDSIRESAANKSIDVIAINLQTGNVNNMWKNGHDAENLEVTYENIRPL